MARTVDRCHLASPWVVAISSAGKPPAIAANDARGVMTKDALLDVCRQTAGTAKHHAQPARLPDLNVPARDATCSPPHRRSSRRPP